MADPNPAEVAIQAWVADAAMKLVNARAVVGSVTGQLASAVEAAAAAEAEHIRALAVSEAAKVGPTVGKAVAEVKADASKAWGWFLKVGVPLVTAVGGGLWWFWPKL